MAHWAPERGDDSGDGITQGGAAVGNVHGQAGVTILLKRRGNAGEWYGGEVGGRAADPVSDVANLVARARSDGAVYLAAEFFSP